MLSGFKALSEIPILFAMHIDRMLCRQLLHVRDNVGTRHLKPCSPVFADKQHQEIIKLLFPIHLV